MSDEPLQPPPKSGFLSSEFWTGLMVVGTGLYLIVTVADRIDPQVVFITGAGMAGVQTIAYSGLRAMVKR